MTDTPPPGEKMTPDPQPEGPEPTWREKLEERRKRRGFLMRTLFFWTGLSTHERFASWAFNRPVSLELKKKRLDAYHSAELVVDTWGKPWMKRRILAFSLGRRVSFQGFQVGVLGIFAVGLGLPVALFLFASTRLVVRFKHRISRPAVQQNFQPPKPMSAPASAPSEPSSAASAAPSQPPNP